MKKNSKIRNEIREFINKKLLTTKRRKKFSDSNSLMDSGIVDSIGTMAIVSFIEENYNLTFGAEEILPENLDSVENIERFIKRKTNV